MMRENTSRQVVSFAVATLFILLAIGTADMPDTTQTYSVKYSVTGTAHGAHITISTPGGGTEQHEVSIPFSSPQYTFKGWEHAYISAQNSGDGGTIGVEINVNGSVLKQARSSGSYSIASVSWLVGSKD